MKVAPILRACCCDRAGTSTIELAIIVPVLALLTFVGADVAMAFKTKIRLQNAAERTAQMASKGGYNSTAYQNLQADAAQAAGVPANAVTITGSLFCNSTAQASLVGECGTGQQMKRYVAININSSYQPMFGALMPGTIWASNDGVAVSGSASVRLQ